MILVKRVFGNSIFSWTDPVCCERGSDWAGLGWGKYPLIRTADIETQPAAFLAATRSESQLQAQGCTAGMQTHHSNDNKQTK